MIYKTLRMESHEVPHGSPKPPKKGRKSVRKCVFLMVLQIRSGWFELKCPHGFVFAPHSQF